MSRKVLEAMDATLDLGRLTITSEKHGMKDQPLGQASNGHLLLDLCPDSEGLTIATRRIHFQPHGVL